MTSRSRRCTRMSDAEERGRWEEKLSAIQPPLHLIPTRPDGSCLFRAFSFAFFGDDENHQECRLQAVQYMSAHPEDFEGFLSPSSKAAFSKYLALMKRPGTWGGNLELCALALTYRVNIQVYRLDETDPRSIYSHEETEGAPLPTVMLAYHTSHTEHYSAIVLLDESKRTFPASLTAPIAPEPLVLTAAASPPPKPLALVDVESTQLVNSIDSLKLGGGGSQEGGERAADPEETDDERMGRVLGEVYKSEEEMNGMALEELKALFFRVMGTKTRLRTPWKIVSAIRAAWKVECALKENLDV